MLQYKDLGSITGWGTRSHILQLRPVQPNKLKKYEKIKNICFVEDTVKRMRRLAADGREYL